VMSGVHRVERWLVLALLAAGAVWISWAAIRKARREVERTRASALWTAVTVGLLALVVILIFVAQNSSRVKIHFLMMDWAMPLGVALLIAALLGALLMLAIGTVRILQLRRLAKRPELVERRRR